MKTYVKPELNINRFGSDNICTVSSPDPEYIPSDTSKSFKDTTYVLDWNK